MIILDAKGNVAMPFKQRRVYHGWIGPYAVIAGHADARAWAGCARNSQEIQRPKAT